MRERNLLIQSEVPSYLTTAIYDYFILARSTCVKAMSYSKLRQAFSRCIHGEHRARLCVSNTTTMRLHSMPWKKIVRGRQNRETHTTSKNA